MENSRLGAALVIAVACLLVVLWPTSSRAQLTPGIVTVTGTGSQYCPTSAGFYNPGGAYTMTCYQGTVTCSQAHPVATATINWEVINAGAPNGTVVMFGGGGGTSASSTPGEESTYVPGYAGAGYTVVQTAWQSPWEEADDGTGTYTDNIRYAACRPAGFLQYVYQNVYQNNTHGSAGMCAQGASAGSGAVAYALAWYGEGAATGGFLDKVELLSGPVFSDIESGCEVPNNFAEEICESGQLGCTGWTTPNGFSPEYLPSYASNVQMWSGGTGPACANRHALATTFNTEWAAMSIVDAAGPDGNPSFSYPNTNMAAWLCETDAVDPLNNSASQGELFYLNFTSSSQLGGFYTIDAVTGCSGDEGVGAGAPQGSFSGFSDGTDAIQFDLSNPLSAARCQHIVKQ